MWGAVVVGSSPHPFARTIGHDACMDGGAALALCKAGQHHQTGQKGGVPANCEFRHLSCW